MSNGGLAMAVGGIKRGGAIGAALLLSILIPAALLLSKPRSGPDRGAVFQDLPALSRPPRSPAPIATSRPISPARADAVPTLEAAGAGAGGHGAAILAAEVRSDRRAILDIDGTLREADVGADKLRAQVARQDDTIAAQRQALENGATPAADRGDAEAALAAAVEMNEAARASLSRYESTRSTLLDRKTSLQRRDAEITSRLKP